MAVQQIERQVRGYGWLVVLLVLSGLGVAIWGATQFDLLEKADLAAFGGFLSGAVTAIWSLAGLILIYVAFLGQRKAIVRQEEEIALNREELRESRVELAGQRQQLEEQSRTLKIQKFENTFFQLLSLHHQIVNNTDLVVPSHRRPGLEAKLKGEFEPERVIRGRDCFREMYARFSSIYEEVAQRNPDQVELERVQEAYERLFAQHESDLGHYFRNLYTIVKFVKRSPVDDKQTYTSIIRAQLSAYELLLLFYNCLGKYGNEKFKPLVEEFHLLKNMPPNRVIQQAHIAYFNSNAYQGSTSASD
ncbi:MAG TPA: putative phage abortive infection protein [Longimicrobiaceae bacterium]|nr:putative phage abortive infection protein [Longimicrobiaceae bacterium]